MQLKGADGRTKNELEPDQTNDADMVDKVLLIACGNHLRELELAAAPERRAGHHLADHQDLDRQFNEFTASAVQFVADNRELIQKTGARNLRRRGVSVVPQHAHHHQGQRPYIRNSNWITDAARRREQEYDRLRMKRRC